MSNMRSSSSIILQVMWLNLDSLWCWIRTGLWLALGWAPGFASGWCMCSILELRSSSSHVGWQDRWHAADIYNLSWRGSAILVSSWRQKQGSLNNNTPGRWISPSIWTKLQKLTCLFVGQLGQKRCSFFNRSMKTQSVGALRSGETVQLKKQGVNISDCL